MECWFFVYIVLCLLNCDWLLVADGQNFLSSDKIAQSVSLATFRPNDDSLASVRSPSVINPFKLLKCGIKTALA